MSMSFLIVFFFFFFQAEDGIRDYKVTGVQTCSSDLDAQADEPAVQIGEARAEQRTGRRVQRPRQPHEVDPQRGQRSEEHTSELQSPCNLVCRLLLEKKKKYTAD